jgi:hypothetical protein
MQQHHPANQIGKSKIMKDTIIALDIKLTIAHILFVVIFGAWSLTNLSKFMRAIGQSLPLSLIRLLPLPGLIWVGLNQEIEVESTDNLWTAAALLSLFGMLWIFCRFWLGGSQTILIISTFGVFCVYYILTAHFIGNDGIESAFFYEFIRNNFRAVNNILAGIFFASFWISFIALGCEETKAYRNNHLFVGKSWRVLLIIIKPIKYILDFWIEVFRMGKNTSKGITGQYNERYEYEKRLNHYRNKGFSEQEAKQKAQNDISHMQ